MIDDIPPTEYATGSSAASPGTEGALASGTRLREFEILSTVGQGGFGVVYLAQDHTLGRLVAIKEFMPTALALRTPEGSIAVRAGEREPFELGLRSFVNEARLLAQFDLPSVVRVYQFWEDRGTAYIVMPFYRGVTLADWIAARARREPLPCDDEVWLLRNLLEPLMSALEKLHEAQCYHRDIAPDNILLVEDSWRPVLLDFGAARNIIGSATRKLTAFVKPGYAPIEQYGDLGSGTSPQGPWTDIYALSAALYHLIAGVAPPASPARLLGDPMPALATLAKGRYTDALLSAIDAGLAVRPEHRPQSVGIWRMLLGGPSGDGTSLGTTPSRLALVDLEPDLAPAPPADPQTSAPSLTNDRASLDFTSAIQAPSTAGPSTAGPSSSAMEEESDSHAPRSLYDDASAAAPIRRSRSARDASAQNDAPGLIDTEALRDSAADTVSGTLDLRRRIGLRRMLNGVGLLGGFLCASALWLYGPPDLLALLSSGGAATETVARETMSGDPVRGATSTPPPAAGAADLTQPPDAGPVSEGVWCEAVLRRAANGNSVSDEELNRYERGCIR